ncbi:MAG TPA: glycoside hydrolase family 44 protein, partial [Chitinophagaceae bacterium]|nr:glycoside hydrolase family 44 protein [Chitinophagaceae bacterium]
MLSGRKPVSPFIYGRNNSLSDDPSNPVSTAIWQRYLDAGLNFYRENGGNNLTKYNWRLKLSSHPDWYNNVYPSDWDFAAASLQQHIPAAQGMWGFQLLGQVAQNNTHNFNDWAYNNSQWWSGTAQNLAGGGTINTGGGGQALVNGDTSLYLEHWNADSTTGILNHWFGNGGLGLDSTKTRYWNMDNEVEIWSGTHDDAMPVQLDAESFM